MHTIEPKQKICIQQFLPTVFVALHDIFHLIDYLVALKLNTINMCCKSATGERAR